MVDEANRPAFEQDHAGKLTWRAAVARRISRGRLKSARMAASCLLPAGMHPFNPGRWGRLGRLVGGIRVGARADLVLVRFPTGHTVATQPGPSALTEAIFDYYLVAYLDQYDLQALLPPGGVLVDVGAHIGTCALPASLIVGAAGKVVSIEPLEENQRCLRMGLDLNGLHNVQVVPCAMGALVGTMELARMAEGSQLTSICPGAETVRVPVRPLDDVVEQLALERVDLIKIDTEGMEREVLLGARRTLERFAPTIAMSGYHRPGDTRDLPALVESLGPGYTCRMGKVTPLHDLVIWATPRGPGRR